MLKLASSFGLQIAFCGFVLLLTQNPTFAQTSAQANDQQTSAADQQIPPAVAKELDAMKKRIDGLEAELKSAKAGEHPSTPVASAKATVPVAPVPAAGNAVTQSPNAPATTTAAANVSTPTANLPPEVAKIEPFSDADWTWLNGNPRTKEIFWDSKFFTPGNPC